MNPCYFSTHSRHSRRTLYMKTPFHALHRHTAHAQPRPPGVLMGAWGVGSPSGSIRIYTCRNPYNQTYPSTVLLMNIVVNYGYDYDYYLDDYDSELL